MEHAKKLMLIEPKLFRPSMREKTLSRLDDDIQKTLDSDLPDGEKAAKYIAALHRYKYYDSPNEIVEEKTTSESDILDTVPNNQRHKAKRILEHLKRDPSLKVNDNGEISYNQQTIPQSHLGDLLNDVLMKKSSKEGPRGWEEFSKSLKSVDVPKDLVENTRRWNLMHPAIKQTKRSGRISRSSSPAPRRGGRLKKTRTPQTKWLDFDD